MKKDKNFYYLCYVLGYDLLNKELKQSCWNECDTTFEVCEKIITKFLKSEENANTTKSQYDSLIEYLENNKSEIINILTRFLNYLPF